MAKKLLIVCDDAGFASVDRGILRLVEATGVPVCAEYLIETDGATERAKEMRKNPLVSLGLHFELTGISDADRVAMSRELKAKGTTLGEQPDIRRKATDNARRQLERFRDATGRDPAHVSTHGDFNVDAAGAVMPWWHDLMHGFFGDAVPPMQLLIPHVRHNLFSWNLPATKRDPRTPDEFAQELKKQTADVVEFVLHPALPEPGDASIDMLFTAAMRVADLNAGIEVIKSGAIERAGFGIATMADVTR